MILLLIIDSLIIVSGDQVARKGGMTGGFYDSRRSRLKFVKIIRDNKSAIDKKTSHLDNVGNRLKDILLWFNHSFFLVT
jgi:structural maintenance of chromosome 3 (chondroitin sulfate proteoglycan 6)